MHNEAWTPELDALATAMRRDDRLSAKVIAARLGRSPGAVSARLLKLGVTIHARVEWDADGEARLRDMVVGTDMPVRTIARELGRTECSVRWKIDDLGLVPGRLRAWTREEDARVLAAAGRPEEGLRALAAEIDRSYEALRARLVHLGVRRKATWDKATVARLRGLAERGATVDEAAAELEREAKAIRAKAYALGLRFPAAGDAGPAWDAAGDAALRLVAAAAGTGAEGVARGVAETGRGARAVKARMRELGLSKARRRRPLDEAGRAEIVAAAEGGAGITAAKRDLGRDARTLREVAAAAGAGFHPVRPSALPQGGMSVRVMPEGRPRPAPAQRAPAPRRAPAPAARPGADRFGMGDAIARFMRERGVTRAGAEDPAAEAVRRVRARGYAVTREAGGGYLVDGRHRLADDETLFSFAAARGIEVPEATA